MSEHDAARQPHSAEDWDELYSGEPVWSGNPNEALVAEVAGLSIGRAMDVGCGEGVAAGLLDASLPDAPYDLVIAMYPALLRTPTGETERRLLDLVDPGGTLLVVHHADIDREHALEQGYDPDDYLSPEDVRALAVERGGWDVGTDERRARGQVLGAGAHHKNDLVVRLRRR